MLLAVVRVSSRVRRPRRLGALTATSRAVPALGDADPFETAFDQDEFDAESRRLAGLDRPTSDSEMVRHEEGNPQGGEGSTVDSDSSFGPIIMDAGRLTLSLAMSLPSSPSPPRDEQETVATGLTVGNATANSVGNIANGASVVLLTALSNLPGAE